MRPYSSSLSHRICAVALAMSGTLAGCGGTDSSAPITTSDRLKLTAAQVSAIDSSGQVITQANPGNPEIKALVDSTLLTLTAGVEAQRIDVTNNLTTKPLYLVGVHRAVSYATGSFSTWSVVAIDDPAKLTDLIEVNGFAQSSTSTPPTTVTGTVGDGVSGINGLFLEIGNAGAVTEWRVASGSATFTSDAPGAACPGFTPTSKVSCALETMHVRFNIGAPLGNASALSRQASVTTDVAVPAMRLTYTP